MDVNTQQLLRTILRENRVDIPEEALRKPISAFAVYPVSTPVGVDFGKVMEKSRQIILQEPWAFDIGNYRGGVDKGQAARIKEACRDQGIPFWEKESVWIYETLRHPDLFPDRYREICEFFGTPVPISDDG